MSKHILIIDDDLAILEAVEILLEEDGYHVSTLEDANVIESFLDENAPDLILLDLLLSGEDGRDVARRIKGHNRGSKIPVLLMSADTHIKEKSEEALADDYIKKPFDIAELEEKLTDYLKV